MSKLHHLKLYLKAQTLYIRLSKDMQQLNFLLYFLRFHVVYFKAPLLFVALALRLENLRNTKQKKNTGALFFFFIAAINAQARSAEFS